MLSRGLIIGKLIDDISTLHSQINLRCQVGLTDLNKFSEDFIKKVLNICYDLSLNNLNADRSNEPGLDLGDENKKIAYQVTSICTSQKINDTLELITADQLEKYETVRIFLLGKRQKTYDAVEEHLKTKCNFITDRNLFDITDLSRQIVTMEFDTLNELDDLFKKEFQKVFIEFEVPSAEGRFPTTLYDRLEISPSTICINANKFLTDHEGHEFEVIQKSFRLLAKLPRVTREFLEILVTQGEKDDYNYRIDFRELKRKLHISLESMREEISILENKRIISGPDEEDMDIITKFDPTLSEIIDFAKEHGCLTKVLVALDFTLLD